MKQRFGLRLLLVLGVISVAPALSSALFAQSSETFYQRMLSRGQLEYEAGQFSEAVRTLQIASFGMLNDLPSYEEAHIYLALSEQGRGELDRARAAIRSVMQVETMRDVYPPSTLDLTAMADFEAAVNRLFPEMVFPPVRSHDPVADNAETELAADEPDLDETVNDIEELTRFLEPGVGADQLRQAAAALETIVERDPTDTDAHLLLARISAWRNEWPQAAEHCRAASIEPEDTEQYDRGTVFVCQVSFGALDAARSTSRLLTDAERRRIDVLRALDRLNAPPGE